jgi:glycosyltransferase involved in cell wall biosynthesis
MIKQPKISVLLTVVNGEKIIEKSILSVLKQTYMNYELIICASGCTDNTIPIIGKMVTDYSPTHKIHFTTLPLVSESDALCWILELATGDLIAIQEAHDVWMPNKLEKQIQQFNNLTESKDLMKRKTVQKNDIPLVFDKGYLFEKMVLQ